MADPERLPLVATAPPLSALERFRIWRDDLRARHDTALREGTLSAFRARLQEPAAVRVEDLREGTEGPLGRAMASWSVGRLESRFVALQSDARLTGDADSLRLLVVATFEEESRADLGPVWMDCLARYPVCDADVFGVVQRRIHAELGRPAALRWPGLLAMSRSRVLLAMGCQELEGAARPLLFAMLTLGSREEREGLWSDIQAAVPYSPELGRQMLQAVRDDPADAFGVTEALRRYASRGQLDLSVLLSSAPDLVTRLLDEEFAGRNATAAFCEAVAQFGGVWAADLLRTTLADASVPVSSRALMLSMFGDSPDVHWTELTDFLALEDESGELTRAATAALGLRATIDEEAFAWLEAQARSSDATHRLAAIEALAASESAGVAPFLLTEVLPTARGAVRVDVVQAYARQPAADAAVLADLTDAGREQDPAVRSAAAWSHLAVGRDVESTGILLERMVTDPDEDVRVFAAVARGLLLEVSGDREAQLAWQRQHDSLSARLARGAAERWLESSWLAGDRELAAGLRSRLGDGRGAPDRDQRLFLMNLYQQLRGSRSADSRDESDP